MNTDSKNPSSPQSDVSPTSRLFDDWIDPIETGVRARVRDWIEALVHSELDTALQRPRYGRSTGGETEPAVAPVRGYRNGSRTRTLTGTFGKTDITVPRARLQGADGATTEWKSKALRAYQRRTKAADALIASAYLSGTNTRRVRRALAALFGGAVGKDTVSRVWRKVHPRKNSITNSLRHRLGGANARRAEVVPGSGNRRLDHALAEQHHWHGR